ncbi:MAG: hypothetical protein HY549_05190 [Elusimicrobia bacterium]|nr:hypothetical protein [Elusimicrobiota bacterium]
MSRILMLLLFGLWAGPAFCEIKTCPSDWNQRRRGDCWIQTGAFGSLAWAYVHPKGWVVDPRCFQDQRFSRRELMEALDLAWRRLSPSVPKDKGGCLSRYNPGWAAQLERRIWTWRMHLSCPEPGGQESRNFPAFCASHREVGEIHLLSLLNITSCQGCPDWLSGVIFHETLHGAGADNFSTEEHNRALFDSQKMGFMRDRVYATSALCYLEPSPEFRRYVNPFMCREVASYGNEAVLDAGASWMQACSGLESHYTNSLPSCMLSHGR